MALIPPFRLAMIKTGKTYDETVFADQKVSYKQKLERKLKQHAKALGFQLVAVN